MLVFDMRISEASERIQFEWWTMVLHVSSILATSLQHAWAAIHVESRQDQDT